MSDAVPIPMQRYAGISGFPAIGICSARVDPETKLSKIKIEFLDGPTEPSVMLAANKRIEELEKDPNVVRIIVSVVTSERRRKVTEVFGRVVLPFKRINGNGHA